MPDKSFGIVAPPDLSLQAEPSARLETYGSKKPNLIRLRGKIQITTFGKAV